MAPMGTPEHIEDCKLRAIKEAVYLCGTNMDMGLTACERILEQDAEVINAILRRNGTEVRR